MKTYPSIPRGSSQFFAHVFDKIDGSNLRFEWSKKRGWYKFGTRKRLFDDTDKVFGPALSIFFDRYAEPLAAVSRDQKWERAVFFMEYAGPKSVAGHHYDIPDNVDDMDLWLIDVAPYKKGMLPPKEFLSLFDHVNHATFLGKFQWGPEFVSDVREGSLEGVTFEGVVGKALVEKKIVMVKAKTQAWIDKVMEIHGQIKGTKLVNS